MLSFIEMVNQTFMKTEIFGLTSHYHLRLQSQNNDELGWFVTVIGNGSEYNFEYNMPEDKSPWKYATITGVAHGLTEAKKYLIMAMIESRGWTTSEELKKLHKLIDR